MKSIGITVLALASLVSASLLHGRAACNADNCLRAVRATNVPTATQITRSSQCSSYMRVTVTPSQAATSRTITSFSVAGNVFNTETYTPGGDFQPNDAYTISGTAVPSYAQAACPSNAAAGVSERFASACSCMGITKVTSMAPTETATSTVTMTTSVTSFRLYASSTAISGYVAKNAHNETDIRALITAGSKGHLTFILNQGHLEVNQAGTGLLGYQAYQKLGSTSYPLQFALPPSEEPHPLVAFSVAAAGGAFGLVNENSVWNICGDDLALSRTGGGVDELGRDCIAAQVRVVPA